MICGMTVLSLMRYEELIAASQSYDISVDDYTGSGPTEVQAGSAATSSTTRFSVPLIDEQLTVIQQRRFPQNTVNNATARLGV